MSTRRLASVLLGIVSAGAAASCFDPVHADAVAELGPEKNGERPGARHRAGQPCLVCHGGKGPGSPEFSVAGTVYATRGGGAPLGDVDVVLTDAAKHEERLVTNEVGNFYARADQLTPDFPLFVRLEYGGTTKEMTTRIGGNGACASCHRGDGDDAHMPGVFMRDK
jgi:cytochrome c553